MRCSVLLAAALVGCKPCEIVCTDVPVPSAAWLEHEVRPDAATGSLVAQVSFDRVIAVGDVDGDGAADIGVLDGAVAQVYSGGELARGRTELLIEIPDVDDIAAAGDIDRDGLADFAAGDGDAWEIHTLDGLHATITATGGGTIVAVAGGGDVDGDGHDDLLVSQWFRQDNRDREEVNRMVGLAQGGSHGFASGVPGFGAVVDLERPHSLAMLGDVDGDGVDDVAAGAARNFAAVHPGAEWGQGPFGGLAAKEVHLHDCWPQGDGCNSWVEVAAPGDVDGDGRPDLIAMGHEPGSAWVIPGADLANDTYKTQLFSGTMAERREIQKASRLVPLGDIDGQTTPLGAPFADLLAIEGSNAWLILGNQLTGQTSWSVRHAVHRFVGFSDGAIVAAGPGDLTGDGLDDLVIGGPGELYVLPAPRPDNSEPEYERVCEEVGEGCKGEG